MSRPTARTALFLLALGGALGVAWLLTPGDGSRPQRLPLPQEPAPHEGLPPTQAVPGAAPQAPARTPDPTPPPAQPAAEARFQGVVQDAGGGGVHDALVELWQADLRAARGAPYPDRGLLATARVERDGTFELPVLGPGPWRLLARAPEHALAQRLLASPGGFVRLTLHVAGTLRLFVLDPSGANLPHASVEISAEGAARPLDAQPDGALLIEGLTPGALRVRVRAPGFAPAIAGPFAIEPGATTEAAVQLRPWVQVVGQIVNPQGQPVAQARVLLARPGESPEPVLSDDAGRFGPVDAGAAGDKVYVSAEADGYAPSLQLIALPDSNAAHEIEVQLTGGPALRGRVVFADGRPAAGALVGYTFDGVAARKPAETRSDEQGRFTLPPAPTAAPGRRVLLFARHAGALAAVEPPAAASTSDVELRLESGHRVTGQLSDASGALLADLPVQLVLEGGVRGSGATPDGDLRRALLNELGFPGLSVLTAGNGRFELSQVPPGRWRVRVLSASGWIPVASAFDLSGDVDLGRLRMGLGARLAGVLRGPQNEPVAGAHVLVAPREDPGGLRRAQSNAQGEFEFAGLPLGEYDLRASREPLAPARMAVDLQRDEWVELDLAAAATLQIAAYFEQRQYDGWLHVTLRRRNGAPLPERVLRVRAGSVAWEDAPIGDWLLEARTPDGRVAREGSPLRLQSGRQTRYLVVLESAASLHGRVLTALGLPARLAQVTLIDPSGTARRASANTAGEFGFDLLAPGEFVLRAFGQGGAPIEQRHTLSPGQAAQVRLELPRAGSAQVRVADEQGRPVSGVLVLFSDAQGAIPPFHALRSDDSGLVRRADLPTGVVHVRARAADGREAHAQGLIVADEQTEITLTLSR